jgi:peroxiredoxin
MKTFRHRRWLSLDCMCVMGAVVLSLVLMPIGVGQRRDSGQAGVFRATSAEAVLKVPAKDFELKDLDGAQVRLSDFRGKQAVLLYFWASWCPGCIAIKPAVAELRSAVSRDRMVILAVNVGTGDTLERLMQYQKGHPTPYPVLYDDGGKVSRAYQVQGIPLFILVDKEGSVIYRDNRLPGNIEKYLGSQ